jgi:uncharacterized protein (TIGR01777 family)
VNILIAGASGFIGKKLVAALPPEYAITVLGRNAAYLKGFMKPVSRVTWEMLPELDAKTFDAIINLCGYNIAASRWNPAVKKQLIDSRVNTTTTLIEWAIKNHAKPHFICANAVGIYGVQESGDSRAFDEDSPIDFQHPPDFLSEIGIRWQQALQPAIDFGMNVTITRFGIVLGKGEGVLKKLGPSFYMGCGSIIGDGKQMMSWVHIDDVVSALLFLLNKPELTGAFNLTSPNPLSQAEFARVLATAMHRPLFLKIPAFVIRTLFGEMGEFLLLKGQRVLPLRLIESGYEFRYPELRLALGCEFPRKTS